MILGVDTGGTFTDFVLHDGKELKIHKVLSTPQYPEQAILAGIVEMGLQSALEKGGLLVIHGSTVATNAALEGKGVKTAYVTNYGFKDLLHIGRQNRPELYNLQPVNNPFPQPRGHCFEVGGRIDCNAQVLEPLTEKALQRLVSEVTALNPESVAINLLFSFLDSEAEERIEKALPKHLFISRSSKVLAEYKEYERGVATWLNAWLGPLMQRYIDSLVTQLAPSTLTIMQSSGGTIDAAQASQNAVRLLLSGPAGGLAAAKQISAECGLAGLITFDMGGTSTDVSLINGDLVLTNEGKIGRFPVAVPMVDIHTIGAGGGSIATIDQGGLLSVGPQSAGANPGPACYGLGGSAATVTDAHTVLGRLRPEYFLGGEMALDQGAATRAIAALATPLGLSLEETAAGIIQIANEKMARALRVISVERGHDPAQFSLCCFGGAGGLHVCSLAESLGTTQAIVPANGGVLSALGMLVAPRERQLSLTKTGLVKNLSSKEINRSIETLSIRGTQELEEEGVDAREITLDASLDVRYAGQSHSLNVKWRDIDQVPAQFHRLHHDRYGHQLNIEVELVSIRVKLSSPAAGQGLFPAAKYPLVDDGAPAQIQSASPVAKVSLHDVDGEVSVYSRKGLVIGEVLVGPALIVEDVSTTWLAGGWQAVVDHCGHLRLSKLA